MPTPASDLSGRYNRSLFGAFQFIEVLREMRPDMPVHLASVFLLVAMRPGIGQRELLNLMDISQPAISRNVAALTERDRHGKPGLNFVVQRRDPLDARNTVLHLTAKGEEYLKRLLLAHQRQLI